MTLPSSTSTSAVWGTTLSRRGPVRRHHALGILTLVTGQRRDLQASWTFFDTLNPLRGPLRLIFWRGLPPVPRTLRTGGGRQRSRRPPRRPRPRSPQPRPAREGPRARGPRPHGGKEGSPRPGARPVVGRRGQASPGPQPCVEVVGRIWPAGGGWNLLCSRERRGGDDSVTGVDEDVVVSGRPGRSRPRSWWHHGRERGCAPGRMPRSSV